MTHAARLALLALAAGPGCTCSQASQAPAPSAATTTAAAEPDGSAPPARPVVLDVVRDLDACALGHRGVLLDFGDPSMKDDVHPGSIAAGVDETVEHEGATWLRARSRSITASFYWPAAGAGEPGEGGGYVEARLRGVTARGAAVFVDGKPAGSWALGKGEARIVVAHPSAPLALSPGGHELSVRFVGGPRAGDEPLAEIDWVHVGAGEPGEPYAAPTRRDVLLESTVGGRSMRALSMRAPGFVRCSGWLPGDATLEASLATVGGGDADLEARLLRDRRPPVVLGAAHVSGGVAWVPWTLPLTGLDGAGALASLELVVKRATKGTRLLLGEPRVIAASSASADAPPAARGVVVVVLGSTSARSLAPWGGPHATPELAAVAAGGTTFVSHRASSSLAAADVASMLTGLPPRVHGLDDPDARLPHGPTTIEEACRQGGVATAMFTANPTTSAAFGFDRGWDSFVAHDPAEDVPSTRVFDDAAAWIDAHKAERFLVVVHARGGHPPWDASPEELKAMPPEGYLGMVEPHRAAEALAKAHRHPGRFKDDDRARAWALYDRAIDAHDAALGRLVAAIRLAGRDEDTALIVTGDVAASESPPVPFVDVEPLDEPLLATPLVVRWPHAQLPARVEAPTSPVDVARTALAALGLAPPAAFEGADLAAVARGALVPAQRPLAATRAGHFAVRWGPFVLAGSRDRETRMCDLSLDPTCVADVRATTPLALEPLHRWTVSALAPVIPPRYPREPATLDARTLAALVRWGRPTDEKDHDEN